MQVMKTAFQLETTCHTTGVHRILTKILVRSRLTSQAASSCQQSTPPGGLLCKTCFGHAGDAVLQVETVAPMRQRCNLTVAASLKPSVPKKGSTALETDEEDVPFFTDSEDEFEDEGTTSGNVSGEEGGPVIEADNTTWGKQALQIAREVLGTSEMAGLELYSFRAIANGSVLDIRLDKLDDRYGSPVLDELETFSRQFYTQLEAALGEEAAGVLTVEISSPGAERVLRVPADLARFQELPMVVTFRLAEGSADTKVLRLDHVMEEELANVRQNRPAGKGSRLTKKQTLQRFRIPLKDLQKVKLFIEI